MKRKEVDMPRPRKYDYKKDYPVKTAIYVKLPVEVANKLDDMDLKGSELSNLVERFLIDYVEKNSKKD
ncbi:hypothetical protein [Niallia circulans]|uniref:hypothetical protein n=1 Tax=Niallia circulans TaxID=1397 RepID=UPI0026EE91AC|nr:hypothetical protein [Niallia circulans]